MRIQTVLKQLQLPADLIDLIRSRQLQAVVELEQRRHDQMNEVIDAWEAANPSLAVLQPWYDSRQAWKAAGRPAPMWWELLLQRLVKPVGWDELHNALPYYQHEWYATIQNDPEKWEKYMAHRRKARIRSQRRAGLRIKEQRARDAAAAAEN